MLKVTVDDNAFAVHLRIEGSLVSPWLGELEDSWLSAQSLVSQRLLVADLNDVHCFDSAGRYLLCWMHATGVRLVASTSPMQTVVDRIAAVPRAHGKSRQRMSHKLVGWFLSDG